MSRSPRPYRLSKDKDRPLPINRDTGLPPEADLSSKPPVEQGSPRARIRSLLKGALWTAIFGTTATVSALAGAALMLTVPLPGRVGEAAAPPLADLWKSGFVYPHHQNVYRARNLVTEARFPQVGERW
ncbi:MAG: hypothetical protein AAFR42_19215, partial [Cyanobacteria bacterium J06628_6]